MPRARPSLLMCTRSSIPALFAASSRKAIISRNFHVVSTWRSGNGGFRVFEFFLPPPVAVFLDQPPRLGEIVLRGRPRVVCPSMLAQSKQPRPVQVNVRHEQRHRAALGDFPGFVQVALRALGAGARAGETAQPGAGEEAAGKVILLAGAAEAVHGVLEGLAARIELVERYALQNRRVERGAAQGEVVEGDVEGASCACSPILSVCAARWETAAGRIHREAMNPRRGLRLRIANRRLSSAKMARSPEAAATRRARGRRGAGRNTGSPAANTAAGSRAGARPASPRPRGSAPPPRPGGPPGAGRRHGSCACPSAETHRRCGRRRSRTARRPPPPRPPRPASAPARSGCWR